MHTIDLIMSVKTGILNCHNFASRKINWDTRYLPSILAMEIIVNSSSSDPQCKPANKGSYKTNIPIGTNESGNKIQE